jgi:hypothetical protein
MLQAVAVMKLPLVNLFTSSTFQESLSTVFNELFSGS